MESFFSRFKNALALIALLLVQTIALATQVNRPAHPADGQRVRLVRLWAIALIGPFERLATWSGHGIRAGWAGYVDLRHVRQENRELKSQVDQLRLQRAALAEDALEAQRLRTLLGFREHFVASTVVAQVIGTSGTDQSRLLTLDKGSNDGLKPDMAVITPDGIVGKLRDVFGSTSQLLLVNDTTSGAGVILANTRIHAILRGSPQGRLQINNLMPDSRIKVGETVLTSGGDGVFPRGLPVGVIETIGLDPEHQPYSLIVLKAAANLSQLDEVLVVTGTTAALNAQEAEDLAADPLAHAANISAEHLPNLHEDKKDGDQASDPASDAAPKPKPALHPDRYSPGEVPAAADLTPGAKKPPGAP